MEIPRKKDRGFTLTELIITIAMLAILVALLLPALQKMRVRSAIVQTSSNLRVASSALVSYIAEHNGFLPDGALQPLLNGQRVPYWFNALDYYAGGDSWTLEGRKSSERSKWLTDPTKRFTTVYYDAKKTAVNVPYGWSHGYFGYTAGTSGWHSRMVEIERPAETIIIGTSKDDPNLESLSHALLYAQAASLAKRFDGRGAYLFLDGHLEILTPEEAVRDTRHLFLKKKQR